MDYRLKSRLEKWHEAIDDLEKIEENFFVIEATEEALEGRLLLLSEGKNNELRMAVVHNNPDWLNFKLGQAIVKANYLKLKRELELKIKAYEAEYLEVKTESEAIKKHP